MDKFIFKKHLYCNFFSLLFLASYPFLAQCVKSIFEFVSTAFNSVSTWFSQTTIATETTGYGFIEAIFMLIFIINVLSIIFSLLNMTNGTGNLNSVIGKIFLLLVISLAYLIIPSMFETLTDTLNSVDTNTGGETGWERLRSIGNTF